MAERNRQGVFIGVTVAVIAVSGLLFFFPESPEQDVNRPKLRAQVIVPRTSTPRNPAPPTGNVEPLVITPVSPKQKLINKKTPTSKPLHEFWQVIYLGDRRIGYSHTSFHPLESQGKKRIHATSEMQLSILRFGELTRMQVRSESVEEANGDLVSFRIENGTGRKASLMEGEVTGGQLIIKTTQNGEKGKRFYAWRAGIKSPVYQDRMVRRYPMKPREIRRFETFLSDVGRTTQVRLAAEGYRMVKLRNGKRQKLLRVRVNQAVNPTEMVDVYLDEKGVPVVSESQFIGKTMSHYTVSQEEALKTIAGAELDIGVGTLIRVPSILKAHQQKKIVYRIQMKNGDPASSLSTGNRQQIKRVDERTVDITVTGSQVPRRRIHVRLNRQFTAPSRYLQSNDSRVREHANRAAGFDTDATQIAKKMEKYVHDKIKNKNFSTAMASAAEVARRLEGDCTEHAVLFAAMLRAKRVPSRIAIGLVYVARASSFGAHMWTEAWINGEWIAFDATLGTGGIGPAHIKLGDASFADNSPSPITAFAPLMKVLGRWRIEVRSVNGSQPPAEKAPPFKRTNFRSR